MRKVLVIEDWPNFVGEIYERASKGTIQGFLLEYELKDMVEFEAETLTEKDISKNAFEIEPGYEGCYGHFLQIPPRLALSKNLSHWRKFKVFVVKKPEKKKG